MLLELFKQRLSRNIGANISNHVTIGMAETDLDAFKVHLTKACLPPPRSTASPKEHWDSIDRHLFVESQRQRKKSWVPVMYLKEHYLRLNGSRWNFNRFPFQNRLTKFTIHMEKRKHSEYKMVSTTIPNNMSKIVWTVTE